MLVRKIFFILCSCLLLACSYSNNNYSQWSIQKKMVGTWQGSEKGMQLEGVEKKWTMVRNSNGTFNVLFKLIKGEEVVSLKETGRWWIEDNLYYEYHKEANETDVYKFEILSEDKIKFIAHKISAEMNTDNFECIDYRVKN